MMYYKILNKDQVEVLADAADDSVHEPIKGYYWAMTRKGTPTHSLPDPPYSKLTVEQAAPVPSEAVAVVIPGQ